jgi:cap1 methyltransferase
LKRKKSLNRGLFCYLKGENGINGDGDVTKSQNLKEFQKFVVDQTNHAGVHFMMADGVYNKLNFSIFLDKTKRKWS